MHHRDPFDRLLIAQAKIHGLALVTGMSSQIATTWRDLVTLRLPTRSRKRCLAGHELITGPIGAWPTANAMQR
jgi:hypothetical protein